MSDSPHDHEREALAFLRQRLYDRDPYRVWANFEFTAPSGKLYEVDALAVTDNGVYLIEIKSHPGEIGGDGTTWQWTTPENRRRSFDNPRQLANRKAKALRELLERSKAFAKHRTEVPYVSEMVFDPDLTVSLSPPGRHQVFGRDAEDEGQAIPAPRRSIGGIVGGAHQPGAGAHRPPPAPHRPAPGSPRPSSRPASASAAAAAASATTASSTCWPTSTPTATRASPTRTSSWATAASRGTPAPAPLPPGAQRSHRAAGGGGPGRPPGVPAPPPPRPPRHPGASRLLRARAGPVPALRGRGQLHRTRPTRVGTPTAWTSSSTGPASE